MRNIMKKAYMLVPVIIVSWNLQTMHADSTMTKTRSWGYIYHASKLPEDYLAKAIQKFNVICISGFKLNDSGNMVIESSRMMKAVAPVALKHRVTLYPMISFQSAAQGRRILNSPGLRAAAIRAIAVLARDSGFTGVHLDFEYLPPADAPRLAEFLSALRRSFSGKISMAVFPPVEFPEKWSRFHDLKLIAPLVDEIVIMCYDLHGAHTGPGPVTDVRWAEKNIRYALRYIKAETIWLGVPAYGYRWCNGKAQALSARQGVKLAGTYSHVRDASGTIHFSYMDSGSSCDVYISDKRTRSLLNNLSSRYGLAGTAVWRLGFDD